MVFNLVIPCAKAFGYFEREQICVEVENSGADPRRVLVEQIHMTAPHLHRAHRPPPISIMYAPAPPPSPPPSLLDVESLMHQVLDLGQVGSMNSSVHHATICSC